MEGKTPVLLLPLAKAGDWELLLHVKKLKTVIFVWQLFALLSPSFKPAQNVTQRGRGAVVAWPGVVLLPEQTLAGALCGWLCVQWLCRHPGLPAAPPRTSLCISSGAPVTGSDCTCLPWEQRVHAWRARISRVETR